VCGREKSVPPYLPISPSTVARLYTTLICEHGLVPARLPRPGLVYCSSPALAGLSPPASGFERGLRRPFPELGRLLAGLPRLRPRLQGFIQPPRRGGVLPPETNVLPPERGPSTPPLRGGVPVLREDKVCIDASLY